MEYMDMGPAPCGLRPTGIPQVRLEPAGTILGLTGCWFTAVFMFMGIVETRLVVTTTGILSHHT